MDVQPFPARQSGYSPGYSPGYSLIEVMVALIVLSVGMLGVAGLFVATLKDSRTSLYRSKAVAFAWDMSERIRANRTAGNAYVTLGADGNCFATATQTNPQSCPPETLAKHDVFEWRAALADTERGLPSGNGEITYNASSTPPTYTITVQWTEGGNVETVRTVTQL